MDPLLERFERLLRSMFQTESDHGHREPFDDRYDRADRDFHDAWDELDDYLRGRDTGGRSGGPGKTGKTGGTTGTDRTGGKSRPRSTPKPPEELRKDYQVLGIPFGSSFEEVRKAHRNLIRTHHPDVHGKDEKETFKATSRTQDINESFQRIKMWFEGR